MLSFGMLADLARSTASRRRVFDSGSGKPWRAAIEISRANLVKSWPRFASAAPFCRLIVDHLECPDMSPLLGPWTLASSQRISITGRLLIICGRFLGNPLEI